MSDEAVADYTQEQAEALDALATAMGSFITALQLAEAQGLKPSEALEGIGIPVPIMFRGTVDRLLADHVASGETSEEELQS